MLPSPPFTFLPNEYRIKLATERWELQESAGLRRRVFCDEQRLFAVDDRDAIDEHAMPLVAVSCLLGMPDQVVGTVRIHRDAPSDDCTLWRGSRLAVDPHFRGIAWIGTELIRLAVGTAHARGCERFLAQVQVSNVKLFKRLHWHTVAEIELHGRSHHLMQADLDHYPPYAESARGFTTLARHAA